MESIHKCCIVTHFRWHWSKQVTNALLMFYVNFKVSNHNDTAAGSDAFSPSAELTRLHVAFHDIDPILLVEGYAGYLVEANNIVLTHQTSLTGTVVDKHAGDGCFTSRDKMGIRRNLLKKMGFTRTTRTKLNHIVVAFNKWNHAHEKNILSPCRQTAWFKAYTAQKKLLPLMGSKVFAPPSEIIKYTSFG